MNCTIIFKQCTFRPSGVFSFLFLFVFLKLGLVLDNDGLSESLEGISSLSGTGKQLTPLLHANFSGKKKLTFYFVSVLADMSQY